MTNKANIFGNIYIAKATSLVYILAAFLQWKEVFALYTVFCTRSPGRSIGEQDNAKPMEPIPYSPLYAFLAPTTAPPSLSP